MAIPVSRFLQDQQIIRHPQNPETPLVSVCMPTYRLRPGGTNQRAIESVLGQTFSDFEFIIVDDGSLDGLYPLILEYQQRDPRIVVIRHEINSGLPGLRANEALMMARGKFIAYMFEDDEWYPNALESLLKTAQNESQECAVYGAVNWTVYNPNGTIQEGILGAWDFNYGLLRNQNQMANCAVLHPRSVLETCGMYDPHVLLRRHCDYDYWLRMARAIPFRRCAEIIGKVTSATKYALGSNVEHDVILAYRLLMMERDTQLVPSRFPDYLVDSLDFLSLPEERYRIYDRYIIPFWQQHPRLLTPGEQKRILASMMRSNRLLVTKGDYSTSVDVTLGNYNRLLSTSGFSLTYVQEKNLAVLPLHRWDYDTLVLYRTIGALSQQALQQAHAWGKPAIYLMDDNMFKFGTGYLADEFSYLKVNAPGYQNLVQEVSEVDLVVSYSPVITRDCKEYNPRTIELSTNIQEVHILDAVPPPGGKESGRRLKYAILTGSARKEELAVLWEAFQEFSRRHPDQIEYHVWGIDPSKFGSLECPVFYQEFNHSYDAYLQALKTEKFDYILCPLFDDHDSKLSKSPVKYLEATVAGAVGIYSDVIVYQAVLPNVAGLKVSNSSQAWLETLEISFNKSDKERHQMFFAAKEHILKEFTSESQILKFLSALESAHLHRTLRSETAVKGNAVIAYFFHETLLGGATLHLMQHAKILSQFGFQPILCFMKGLLVSGEIEEFAKQHGFPIEQLDFRYFVSAFKLNNDERQAIPQLRQWMLGRDVRFVHMVTYMPEVIQAAYELGIPRLVTLHQHYDDYYAAPPEYSPVTSEDEKMISVIHSSSLRYAEKWQAALDIPAFCIRAPIADSYFEQFALRRQCETSVIPAFLISGTLQPRKGQLEAIHAIAKLRDRGIRVKLMLLGYDNLFPDYVELCRQAIEQLNLQDAVQILGFAPNPQPYYNEADYLFCASSDESMSQSILKGMAAGIRVISTPAGGVKELITDGFSGIIAHGFEIEDLEDAMERALSASDDQWNIMQENAHLAARMSCAYDVVTYKLLGLYHFAVEEKSWQGSSDGSFQSTRANLRKAPSKPSPAGAQATRNVNLLKTRILSRLSRARMISEFMRLLWDHESLEGQVLPAFTKLQEDSYAFIPELKGHVLQPSVSLNQVEFLEYPYEFQRANLKSISIALTESVEPTSGSIGLEIVSPKREIVTQVVYPLAKIDRGKPVEFVFNPIRGTSEGTWLVRVFVRDVSSPIETYEWKKAVLTPRGLVSRKGFMGFSFEDAENS